MVRRRCCVCLVLKDRSVVQYNTAAGYRCRNCYQMGRELRDCNRCGEEKSCRRRGVTWYCQACLRVEDLMSGVVTSTRRFSGVDFVTLVSLHLTMRTRIDLWIIALTPECWLILVRIIFWRRFGILAGLLPGAPAGTYRFSHGARALDARKLANHIANLRRTDRWPRESAPIILTGCSRQGLQEVIGLLPDLPLGQRNRLAACPFTLSEHSSNSGFNLQRFLRAPSTPDLQSCLLMRRARAALSAAGVVQSGTRQLTEDSSHGRAFRCMLFGDS